MQAQKTPRTVLTYLTAIILGAFFLSACGSTSGDSSSYEGAAPEQQVDYDAADAGAHSQTGDDLETDTARQVISTASATLEVDDTAEATQEAVTAVESRGGYVESRHERTDDDGNPATATLTVRVPQDNFQELLDSLEEIGDVLELSQGAEDVTGTMRDLDARIEALETSTARLLEIMEEASSSEELLQVETSLSERQAELEALQAQRNALAEEVSYSTLSLELASEEFTEVQADGFLGGLQSGWNGLISTLNVLLVVAGALLPWLPVLAIPTILIIWLVRRSLKKSRQIDAQRAQFGYPPAPQGVPLTPDGYPVPQQPTAQHPEAQHPEAPQTEPTDQAQGTEHQGHSQDDNDDDVPEDPRP